MEKIYFPFYQVKVAGHVVNHTNSREVAHADAVRANARPAEIWLIHASGGSQLVSQIAA